MKRSYMEVLGSASPTARAAQRVGDMLAALAPPAGTNALVKKDKDKGPSPSFSTSAVSLLPGAAGAVAGALLFRKHWVLGALGGLAVVTCGPGIYRGGDDRRDGLSGLVVSAAGITGSLMAKRRKFWGYVAGSVVGMAATALYPDTPTNKAAHSFMDRLKAKAA